MRKSVFGFLTRYDTNQAHQPQEMARGLNLLILKFLWSENRDADELPGYNTAYLGLCFRIKLAQTAGFLMTRLISSMQPVKALVRQNRYSDCSAVSSAE